MHEFKYLFQGMSLSKYISIQWCEPLVNIESKSDTLVYHRSQNVFDLVDVACSVYDCETCHGLSNHLPMVLVALSRMNVPVRDQREYFSQYSKRFLTPPSLQCSNQIPGGDISCWKQFIGKKEQYRNYVNYFAKSLNSAEDVSDLLFNEYLPFLSKGILTALFHPIIQIGYGLILREKSKNPEELQKSIQVIAAGISYLISHYQSIHLRDSTQKISMLMKSLDEPSVIDDVHRNPTILFQLLHEKRDEFISIISKIKQVSVATFSRFQQIADACSSDLYMLKEVVFSKMDQKLGWRTYLGIFANISASLLQAMGTQDVITLHAVTACHALRIIIEMRSPKQNCPHSFNLLQSFYEFLVLLYLSNGCPPIDVSMDKSKDKTVSVTSKSYDYESVNWETMIDHIVSNPIRDEHDIKFIFTCMEEASAYPMRARQYYHLARSRLSLDMKYL